MKSVGVRELKAHASEILRGVRERGEMIELTFHGRAIALLVPIEAKRRDDTDWHELWADMDRLAEEIAAYWPEGVSAAEAVAEDRRRLDRRRCERLGQPILERRRKSRRKPTMD